MPELPEVENLVRRLRESIVGSTITGATLRWKRTIERLAPKEFAQQVVGLSILSIDRRAKYLVFALAPVPERSAVESQETHSSTTAGRHPASTLDLPEATQFLLIHLRMSGKLSVKPHGAPIEKHDRVIFNLDGERQLHFNDTRKFGRMWLVPEPAEVMDKLGPEPLAAGFTLPKFRELVKSRSGAIKPLLLNQEFLSGVGNIYADESLWLAKIHPLRKADSLNDAEIAALYRSIRKVLRKAIEDQGTDAGDGIIEGNYQPRVYGREGQPCFRCHRPIHKIVVGQRGTHFCPYCQPKRNRLK